MYAEVSGLLSSVRTRCNGFAVSSCFAPVFALRYSLQGSVAMAVLEIRTHVYNVLMDCAVKSLMGSLLELLRSHLGAEQISQLDSPGSQERP